MSGAETIARIVAGVDMEKHIIPYSPEYRDQAIALALEMHDNDTFREYPINTDKLIEQFEIAEKYPDTLHCRMAVRNGELYGGFYGQIHRMFFSNELMARDIGWWVKRDRRGTWAAICLLADFEQWAKSRGCLKVMLGQSSAMNIDTTTRLYENCGYRVIGVNTCKEL